MAKERKTTGKDLLKWRKLTGRTQEQAAEYFGFTRSYWNQVEGGHRAVPQVLAVAVRCEMEKSK